MVASLNGQLMDWKYGRSIVKCFIQNLSDNELDRILPRKNLNTIRKQCEELVQIQSCYVRALKTRTIDFTYQPLSNVSKDSLLNSMNELDERNESYLQDFDGTEVIRWFGEEQNVHQHVSAMIGHEQMHIGQIIAFCYATSIEIPDEIVHKMSLNG